MRRVNRCHSLPLGVSVPLTLAALALFGCAHTAFAQQHAVSPLPTPTESPAAAPDLATPTPLPVRPPEIIAEPGILPTSPLVVLDRLDEFLERTVFSFGIPTLRGRIALHQAAERIAEMLALERRGDLTPPRIQGLLVAHERLLAIADGVLADQIARGRGSPQLVLLLLRTRLSAADIIAELAEEIEVEVPLVGEAEGGETPSPVPDGAPLPEAAEEEAAAVGNLAELLEETADRLVDAEEVLVPAAVLERGVPANILRLLAEEKVAKAERDFQRATAKVEERLAHGKILIGEIELQTAAAAALTTARQHLAQANFLEAIAAAREARRISGTLKSGKIAIEPEKLFRPQGEEDAEDIIRGLGEEGFIGRSEEAAALQRAREAAARVRASGVVPVVGPEDGEEEEGKRVEERDRRGRRGGERREEGGRDEDTEDDGEDGSDDRSGGDSPDSGRSGSGSS